MTPLHGFVFGDSEVFDQAEYDAYRAVAQSSVRAFGGTALLSGTRFEPLEGTRVWHRLVLVEFPTLDAARAWHCSELYRPMMEQRLKGARSSVVLLEETRGRDEEPGAPLGDTPAYMLGDVTEIRDLERFKQYLVGTAPTIAAAGGRYLSKGGRVEHAEGAWRPERLVLIEFASWEIAAAWYASEAYRPLAGLRRSCADTDLVLVEGFASEGLAG